MECYLFSFMTSYRGFVVPYVHISGLAYEELQGLLLPTSLFPKRNSVLARMSVSESERVCCYCLLICLL